MSPKIVILDGYRINPDDLSWDDITKLGDVTIYDRTAPNQVLSHIGDADIVLTNKTVIDAATIKAKPQLRYIGVLATGTNVVDVNAAKEAGIIVTNIPAYSTMSVAQQAITLLLTITGQVQRYTDEIRRGEWSSKPDFCYWNHQLIELAGRKIGIVGFGNIGQAVAHIAEAIGMTPIIATSRDASQLPTGMIKAESIDNLFATCDVISLHCPLADDTYHLVDARRIALMKPDAILINTARGQLVDEQALADALNSKRIYAAGLDVLEQEPPTPDCPLLHARNCYITPHIGWATLQARARLIAIAAENLHAYLTGQPINVV